MNRIAQGIIAGLVFGVLDVLVMIPIPMPNKAEAMLASFINRFAIGFLVANVSIPVPGWVRGLIIGILLSFPDAVISKAYAPVLGIGVLGGVTIGLLVERL